MCGALVTATDWKVFSCYNLSAANPLMPSWEIIGGYWQWGRAGQAAPGPAGLNGSITNEESISGWDQGNPPDNSWLDTNPMNNNPCPAGFRVPTSAQWDGVRNFNAQSNEGTTWNSGAGNYSNGKKFGTALFLPAAGNRSSYGGWLQA